MEVLRDCKFLTKYIHVSSSMVYGDFESNPVTVNSNKSQKKIWFNEACE